MRAYCIEVGSDPMLTVAGGRRDSGPGCPQSGGRTRERAITAGQKMRQSVLRSEKKVKEIKHAMSLPRVAQVDMSAASGGNERENKPNSLLCRDSLAVFVLRQCV